MDRSIIYTQEQGRSIDILFAQKSSMIALSKLAAAVLGTGNTFVNGLAVAPTAPASMAVQVAPGEVYAMTSVDATAYGILPADTTHTILKQGVMLDALNLSCPAPVTVGYSINYLVQVAYQDSDTTPVVLPYFNSANPSQPLSGQSNSGAAQATERQGLCIVAVKAGAAATTGTQTTPAPDSGYTGLKVVTVAYGATTITSGNITAYASAPYLPTDGLLRAAQNSEMEYAIDTSASVNALVATTNPPVTALTDGLAVTVIPAITNTGAATFNLGGLGIKALIGYSGALTGGELIAGKPYKFVYNVTANSWITTGGITQSQADARYVPYTIPNNTPVLAKNAAGTASNLILVGSDNYTNLIDAGGAGCRILTNGAGATGTLEIATGTALGHAVNYAQAIPIRTANVTPLLASGSTYSASHSLGVVPVIAILEAVCLTAEQGYSIGDVVQVVFQYNGSVTGYLQINKSPTTVAAQLSSGYSLAITNKTNSNTFIPTAANWAYRFVLR